MTVRRKFGMVLEDKLAQKLKLENNVFNEKWSPKLIFLNEKFEKNPMILDIKNRLSKYNFATF